MKNQACRQINYLKEARMVELVERWRAWSVVEVECIGSECAMQCYLLYWVR